jgi:hypothetical protein
LPKYSESCRIFLRVKGGGQNTVCQIAFPSLRLGSYSRIIGFLAAIVLFSNRHLDTGVLLELE